MATDAVSIVDADGAAVTVLALGAQLPELFPYPVRLATWLCSSGRVVLDVTGSHHRQHGRRSVGPAQGPPTTIAYPRVRAPGGSSCPGAGGTSVSDFPGPARIPPATSTTCWP